MAGPRQRVLGLDEAGRGSVLGPLAIAGVALDDEALAELVALGVDDSKRLSPRRRESLAVEIRARAVAFEVVLSPPPAIDACRADGGLDVHEARLMAAIIDRLRPDRVLADAPGPGGRLFKRRLIHHLDGRPIAITAENGADGRYPIVGAASILAKTARDAAIAALEETYGPVGSGYPSDPNTIRFLEDWRARGEGPPDCCRKTWGTVLRIFGPRQMEMF